MFLSENRRQRGVTISLIRVNIVAHLVWGRTSSVYLFLFLFSFVLRGPVYVVHIGICVLSTKVLNTELTIQC